MHQISKNIERDAFHYENNQQQWLPGVQLIELNL